MLDEALLQKARRPSRTAVQLQQQAASQAQRHTPGGENVGTQSCSRYGRMASCLLSDYKERSAAEASTGKGKQAHMQTPSHPKSPARNRRPHKATKSRARAERKLTPRIMHTHTNTHLASSSPNLFTDTGAADIKVLCSLRGIPPFSCFKGKQMKTNLILLAPPLCMRLSYALLMC